MEVPLYTNNDDSDYVSEYLHDDDYFFDGDNDDDSLGTDYYFDDDYINEEDDDDDDDDDDEDEDEEDADVKNPTTPTKQAATPGSVATPTQTTPPAQPPTPPAQPFPLVVLNEQSQLGKAAAAVFTSPGYSLKTDIMWQSNVKGESAAIKTFRQEVTQQKDAIPFAFMRPASPIIQILHSVATYAVRGGDSELQNKDFGFTGDRTKLRFPAPVMLDETMWKWVKKTIGLDVPPIEGFYANPANARKLYFDSASGGTTTIVPRMAYLPPPFLAYCVEAPRTPFELHQFITRYATRVDAEITINDCTLLMDWCVMATQTATAANPTTSMLATSLTAAPTDDEAFLQWLYKIDHTNNHGYTEPLRHPTPTTTTPALPLLPTQGQPHNLPGGAPTIDVWKQMAKDISTSFASAAAAIKTHAADDADTSYESGGKTYDKFQMAAIQGFANVPNINGVPYIWALFQYTKDLETHKNNIKRRMAEWATSDERDIQVQIDRSLFITDATMKEILSLQFNPGGVIPEAEDADLGLSILICRARTQAAKAAIRKHEKARKDSVRNRSLAEAEAALASSAYDTGSLPDDYNELLRCVGTYCALLYTLFGKRCAFYRQCYALWMELNSDLVFEQRHDFSVLFCRQIVWAVLAESRAYFSNRMTVDDFTNVRPENIRYPRCSLSAIFQNVRDVTPIIRASFPQAWHPGGQRGTTAGTVSGARTVASGAPVQSVMTGQGGAAATVVSGITTGSSRTPRPPVSIRASNVHPTIKGVMEAYIQKNNGTYLNALLTHCNISLDDLPKLTPDLNGAHGICYNYVLGCCNMDGCQYEHLNARDIPDDFATELINKLRPGITEFTANGVPDAARRRRRRRRRTGTRTRE